MHGVYRISEQCDSFFFSFSTQDGTAVSTNNVDYDRVSGSLAIFNAGDTNDATKQISVSIIDDSRTETTESFTVTLSAVNGGGLVPTTSSTATVNIVDNDSMYLLFLCTCTRTITNTPIESYNENTSPA